MQNIMQLKLVLSRTTSPPFFAEGANLGGMSMPQGLQNLPNLQNLLGDPRAPQDALQGCRNGRTSDLSFSSVDKKALLGDAPNSADF